MGRLLKLSWLLVTFHSLAGVFSPAALAEPPDVRTNWGFRSPRGDLVESGCPNTQTARHSIPASILEFPGDLLHRLREGPSPSVSRFGYGFWRRTTDHFQLLYHGPRLCQPVAMDNCALLEKAYRAFYADFIKAGFELHPTSESLPWIVFENPQEYRDFARVADRMESPSLESYYSIRSNQVVLIQVPRRPLDHDRNPKSEVTFGDSGVVGMDRQPQADALEGDGTVLLDVRRSFHEVAHQLAFNSGLQKRGVTYPLWVSEGLATNFETDSLRAIGVARHNYPRQRQLLRAHDAGRLMPLKSFVTLVQFPAGDADLTNDLYAQAWALFNFLFQTRQAELRDYLGYVSTLGTGPRTPEMISNEFTSTFGPIEAVERAWQDYIGSLRSGGS